jgi:hypothetical protein
MSDFVHSYITNSAKTRWYVRQFDTSSLYKAVTLLHFTAHAVAPNNEGNGEVDPTNHWTVYLQIEESSSVRLEVIPTGVGSAGVIVLENKTYAATINHTHMETINVTMGTAVTVSSILNVIIEKNRDKYNFAPVGEGCRFWTYTFATDLANAGVISRRDANVIQAALVRYWPAPKGTAPMERPMAEGSFYD